MSDRHAGLRATIVAAHDRLGAELNGLAADAWQRPSQNEGWTVKDTVAHLASIEERIRAMVRSVVAGAVHTPEDVHTYNGRMIDERRSWSVEQLRAELAQERAISLALLDGLGEGDLDRQYAHPSRGMVTIEQLWQIIPNHINAHLADIATAREK